MAKSTVEECHSLLAAVCAHHSKNKWTEREKEMRGVVFFQWVKYLSRKVETLRPLVAAGGMGALQNEILSRAEGVIVKITAGYRVSTESEQV